MVIFLYTLFLFTNVYSSYEFIHQPSNDKFLQVFSPSTCKYNFVNQTFGIITSPYYPLGYTDNTSCEWAITMEEQSRVVLAIRNMILGPEDRLEISDETSRRIYSLGDPPNDVIYSSGNMLTIRLISSNNNSTDTLEQLKKNRTFYAIFDREGCGGLLTDITGYISVPSYIHMSQMSHECAWTLLSPANKVIVLQFLQFDLPPGSCLYSNMYIREGNKNAGYILGTFCEENPPLHQLRTSSNIMYITYRTRPNFLSMKSEMIPVIKMYYKTVDACGGLLDGYSGAFDTPKRWLDDVYVCNWTIEVPPEKIILLKIRRWNVYNKTDEEHEQLKIFIPSSKSVFWSSNGYIQPPESMIISNNKVIISLISYRNKTSTTKIRFQGIYEAMNSPEKQCIDVGSRQLLMCDEWRYIDCSLRCDGVVDCDNGKDENDCPNSKFDNSIIMQHVRHRDSNNARGYFIFLFAVVGIIMIVVLISITVDRIYRNGRFNVSKKKKYNNKRSSNDPPPYTEVANIPTILTPPPPYSAQMEESVSEDFTGYATICLTNFQVSDCTCGKNSTDGDLDVRSEPTELFHDTDILEGSSDAYTGSDASFHVHDITTTSDLES